MTNNMKKRLLLSFISIGVLTTATIGTVDAKTPLHQQSPVMMSHHPRNTYSLGSPHLNVSKNEQQLAPGVSYSHIQIGEPDEKNAYTIKVDFYESKKRALYNQKILKQKGFKSTIRQIKNTLFGISDINKKSIGYVLQTGHFSSEAATQETVKKLKSLGYANADTTYIPFDGTTKANGPWDIHVVEINPHKFKGKIKHVLADNTVEGKETVSTMSKANQAIAGINGGYFVMGETDGTPGDAAGISVTNGQLNSESVGNRTSLIFNNSGAQIASTKTQLTLSTSTGQKMAIDGINRKPGLVRSCGGIGDTPTDKPEQDVTCTDSSEIIEFNSVYGKSTPSGKGVEVILNKNDKVIKINSYRGNVIPKEGYILTGTGTKASWMKQNIHIGDTLHIDNQLLINNKRASIQDGLNIVNGGPRLLKNGEINIDAKKEGFDWSNSFYYDFGLYRQPRTLAGVKKNGDILFVTVDGRDPAKSIGVSFLESAKLMKSLGAVQAMNLDGGGSTTMTIHNHLVNHPSDSTGERKVGDAILLTK